MKYKAYLESQDWANKRLAVFDELGYGCYACRSRKRIDIHHLRYRNLTDVRPSDLIPLCHACHQIAHYLYSRHKITRSSTRDETRREIQTYLRRPHFLTWLFRPNW